MTSSSDFSLQRTIKPYVGELVIAGIILVGLVIIALKTLRWDPLGVAVIGCFLMCLTHYPDLRYRVFWRDGAVVRITANNVNTTIKASEISRIAVEQSDVIAMLSLRRPIRRITIYGDGQQHLDVSLRHFELNDIRRLMEEIRKARPDLSLPTI